MKMTDVWVNPDDRLPPLGELVDALDHSYQVIYNLVKSHNENNPEDQILIETLMINYELLRKAKELTNEG